MERGADTRKRNLIAHQVAAHHKRGMLQKFTNEKGDFMTNSGKVRNIHEPFFQRLRDQLEEFDNNNSLE